MYNGGLMLFPNPKPNKTYCVGVDGSLTSTGVYCLPIGHDEWYGWATITNAKSGSDTRRVMDMAADITDCMDNLPYAPACVVFEDYGPINRTSGKVAQRAELCGIIKHHVLRVLRIPVITIPPTSLKQFSTGKGNSDKNAVRTAAAKLNYFPETHDEADAFFAARLGACIYHDEPVTVGYTVNMP